MSRAYYYHNYYLIDLVSQEMWTQGNFDAAAIFSRKLGCYVAMQQQYFLGNFDRYTCTNTSYFQLTKPQALKLKAKLGAPSSRIP